MFGESKKERKCFVSIVLSYNKLLIRSYEYDIATDEFALYNSILV